ncbi:MULTISPECIES: AbrB/MazE/SpoVT family DNA-binding domain-containing protein [Acidianus]|jgi:AbrB family looped-hinge helix DNA binding protein|uniref:AbrB/MazE/SpoVT family DNA-binding domain-containing protein n=1 Tax=Acidianus ambivalens TaxID=2283 RepID=A0A650CTA1_ACIAM|nr:AbrB/MazE/SpoVT family DNA-binding domain-containing protein [Acidianus ambivalens]MQL55504.1 AbrB/MazE/SpoVT family DNA-binding domain-containing protein [Acidianus ambivalens]QGR21036.1 AbrB/MazE/SpoVT family DNA-binding domain-containing protein [Acidianus ambivalens]
MEEVKVTRNYQITIPYNVREKLGIKIGDKLVVYVEGDKIIIRKKAGNIASLNLTLGKKITDKEINEAINEAGEKIGSGS